MVRLTAFAKYDRMAASTRQRLLQYVPALEAAGVQVDYRPLLDDAYVASLAGGPSFPRRRVAAAYSRRLREVTVGPLGDVVWVYAELFPRLPALFERLLVRRGRPFVYDLDDAFFHAYDQHESALVRSAFARKLEPLMKSASACTCGNEYLRSYAARFCRNSLIVPTAVDTDAYVPARASRRAVPVIGWIGSPSTWPYVRPLLPLLEQFVREGRARVHIVGAGAAASDPNLAWADFIDWREESEISELQRMDIGIMPLPDEPWTRGKSGYKLIQYMACGLPVIASPVGVNCEIVRDGANGFLATDLSGWHQAMDRLLTDRNLRQQLGDEGRRDAVAAYSLAVHAPRVVGTVLAAAESARPTR